MKKLLYLSLLICTSALQVHAQRASVETDNRRYAHTQKSFTVAVQPMQFYNNSIRYDFEVRLGKGPGWLQFGPAFYYKPYSDREKPGYYYEDREYYRHWFNFDLHEPFSGLKGGGLDLNYKHFLDPRRSFYFAVGLSYANFNIKYWARAWDEFTEDGLQYLEYKEAYRTQQIERYGFNNFIGFQIPTRSAFLFDVFSGYALRFASSDENKPAFDRYMYSYGYSGIVFLMGFRIGFGIR